MTVVKLACPECYSTNVGVDPEGAACCNNGHEFWDSNGVEADVETLINLLRRAAPLARWAEFHQGAEVEAQRFRLDVIEAIGGEKARSDGLLSPLGRKV